MTEAELNNYIIALIEKSNEAYLMSIEIVNKPTINYRTEGFCFFICNAWELMLKAFLINKKKSIKAIQYSNNKSKTVGLAECSNRVFTSTTDITRINLDFIRKIRNIATHDVISDFDYKYAPIFQKCLKNYLNFRDKYFADIGIVSTSTPFISLASHPERTNYSSPLSLNPQTKYIMDKLNTSITETESDFTQIIKLVNVKNENDADIKFYIDNYSIDSSKIRFVEKAKDVDVTHPYSASEIVNIIKENIEQTFLNKYTFNQHYFNMFIKDCSIKDNQLYCYTHKVGNSKTYTYSIDLLELFVSKCFENNKYKKKYLKKK